MEAHLSDNPLTAGTIAPGARMDLVVYPSDGGPVQWIDPTVICPITSSSNSYILASRAAGTTCPLRDAEANKRRTYGAAANRAGAVLFPFAYDTFTRRGEEAKKFLAQLARRTVAKIIGRAQSAGESRNAPGSSHRFLFPSLMTRWGRRISCCIQIQNALLITQRRASAFERAAGRPRTADRRERTTEFSALGGTGPNPLADQAYWQTGSDSSGF